MKRIRRRPATRGLSITDVLVLLVVFALTLGIALPSLGTLRSISKVEMSKGNLITLTVAHTMYAADYNGQQYTPWPHDLTDYGNSINHALSNYQQVHGANSVAMRIGWTDLGVWWITGLGIQAWAAWEPINFQSSWGAFRMDNVYDFIPYVNGRFYDSTFYPPNDPVLMPLVEPLFDLPIGLNPSGPIFWPGYVRSPAALFNPEILRAPSAGGWQDPWQTWGVQGYATMPLHGAQYADLKTHIIEHNWNQNTLKDFCSPYFSDPHNNCAPYFFNHSMNSEPVTLFYDGHVRLLPNTEVHASDQQVLDQTNGVDGLWSRDTPFGTDGYFNQFAADPTDLSHHILTTDGILGRDTLGPMGLRPPMRRR